MGLVIRLNYLLLLLIHITSQIKMQDTIIKSMDPMPVLIAFGIISKMANNSTITIESIIYNLYPLIHL
jgi:uncharacterized membrane protein YjdF